MKLKHENIAIEVDENPNPKESRPRIKITRIEEPDVNRTFYSTKFDGSNTAFHLNHVYDGRIIVEDGKAFLDQKDRKIYMGEVDQEVSAT